MTVSIANPAAVRLTSFEAPSTVESNRSGRDREPNRTASAKMTSQFRQQIMEIIQELKRTAQEEKWKMNWEKFEELRKSFQAAIDKKRPREAFHYESQMIDEFMRALKHQRNVSQT